MRRTLRRSVEKILVNNTWILPGAGDHSSDDVVSFSHFLRQTVLYSDSEDRMRASNSAAVLLDNLTGKLHWRTVPSCLAISSLCSTMKIPIESSVVAADAIQFLRSNAAVLSIDGAATVVLLMLSVEHKSWTDVQPLLSRVMAEGSSSFDNLIHASKVIRVIEQCSVCFRQETAELARSHGVNQWGERLRDSLTSIEVEATSTFLEPLSVLIASLPIVRDIIGPQASHCLQLAVKLLDSKVLLMKTQQAVAVLPKLFDAIDLLERPTLLSIISRIMDRVTSLAHVLVPTEFFSLCSVFRDMRRRLQADADCGTKEQTQDLIDFEAELSTFVQICFFASFTTLTRNFPTDPDDYRSPSKAPAIQRLIPSLEDIVRGAEALSELRLCLSPIAQLCHSGALVPGDGFRSDRTIFGSKVRQSLLEIELHICLDQDIVRSRAKSAHDDLQLDIFGVTSGWKYSRSLNFWDSAENTCHLLRLSASNEFGATLRRYVPLSNLIIASMKILDPNMKEFSGLVKMMSKIRSDYGLLYAEADAVTSLAEPHKKDKYLRDLVNTLALHHAIVPTEDRPVVHAMRELFDRSLEALAKGLRPIGDNEVAEEELMWIATALRFRDLASRVPIAYVESVAKAVSKMIPASGFRLLSCLVRRFSSSTDKTPVKHQQLLPIVSVLKKECVRQLSLCMSRGSFSLMSMAILWRFLEPELDHHANERDLSEFMLRYFLKEAKSQCRSIDVLAQVAEEAISLAHRTGNTEKAKEIRNVVSVCCVSLLKGGRESAGNVMRIIRSFPFSSQNRELTSEMHEQISAQCQHSHFCPKEVIPLNLVMDAVGAIDPQFLPVMVGSMREQILFSIESSTIRIKGTHAVEILEIFRQHAPLGVRRVSHALTPYYSSMFIPNNDLVKTLPIISKARGLNTSFFRLISQKLPTLNFDQLVVVGFLKGIFETSLGATAHYLIVDRVMQILVGCVSARLFTVEGSVKDRQIVDYFRESDDIFCQLLREKPTTTLAEWKKMTKLAHSQLRAHMQSMLTALRGGLLASLVQRCDVHGQRRENLPPAFDRILQNIVTASNFALQDKNNFTAEDFEAQSIFDGAPSAANDIPSRHSSSRCVTQFTMNYVLVLVTLLGKAELQHLRDGELSMTKLFLELANTAKNEAVIICTAEDSEKAIQKESQRREKDLSAVKTSRDAAKWYQKYKPLSYRSGNKVHVRLSSLHPLRTCTVFSQEQFEASKYSVFDYPHFLPRLREEMSCEMKALPKLLRTGKCTTLDVHAVAKACLTCLQSPKLFDRIMNAWEANFREGCSTGIAGISALVVDASIPQSVRDRVVSQLGEHMKVMSPAALDKSFGSLSVLMKAIESCPNLLGEEAVRSRIIGRLESLIPHASAPELASLLRAFGEGDPKASALYDARLILSKIPLYMLNDLEAFSGEEVYWLCSLLHRRHLLARETLDDIIAKVENPNLLDGGWTPPSFDAGQPDATRHVSAEKVRVANRLRRLSPPVAPENRTDDSFEP